MKSFARVTKLTNVVGRAMYIADPNRQEEILFSATTEAVEQNGWQLVADYERRHQKSAAMNNQGREIIVQLPNSWANLPPSVLQDYVSSVAFAAVGHVMPYMQIAVHWNHARTNLHLHVIFSEREQYADTTKRYDRDIYRTADGKVARCRADRAHDAAGSELPPIHRKGELVNPDGFSPKLREFKAKSYPEHAKARAAAQLERLGVQLEKQNAYGLHEYHEGKGRDAEVIAAKNVGIRAYNACIAFLIAQGLDNVEVLKTLQKAALGDLRANLSPRVHYELWHDPDMQRTVYALCQQALQQYHDPCSLHQRSRSDTIRWATDEAKRRSSNNRPRWHTPDLGIDR